MQQNIRDDPADVSKLERLSENIMIFDCELLRGHEHGQISAGMGSCSRPTDRLRFRAKMGLSRYFRAPDAMYSLKGDLQSLIGTMTYSALAGDTCGPSAASAVFICRCAGADVCVFRALSVRLGDR